MARTRYLPDRGLSARMGLTMFLLGLLYVVLIGVIASYTNLALGLIIAAVGLVLVRYAYWRLFGTVLPADGEWYEVAWVWFCYGVEVFAIFDALILYAIFLRRADRSGEADINEARLRLCSEAEYPSVDVLIPTYNESLDVLEKTITGALCGLIGVYVVLRGMSYIGHGLSHAIFGGFAHSRVLELHGERMPAGTMLPLYSVSFTVPLTVCWVWSTKAVSASRKGVNHSPL